MACRRKAWRRCFQARPYAKDPLEPGLPLVVRHFGVDSFRPLLFTARRAENQQQGIVDISNGIGSLVKGHNGPTVVLRDWLSGEIAQEVAIHASRSGVAPARLNMMPMTWVCCMSRMRMMKKYAPCGLKLRPCE